MKKSIAIWASADVSKIVQIVALGAIVGTQILIGVLRIEYFPWSTYPMYGGRISERPFYGLVTELVATGGDEVHLENVLIPRPKYELYTRFDLQALYTQPASEKDLAVFDTFSSIFHSDLTDAGKVAQFKGVRYYVEYWNRFDGQARFRPDQRKLVYEKRF